MSEIDNTVFISYRRSVSRYSARAIFMDLRAHGYDVFMDVESIDSGYFDSIILNQIAARKHFLVILTPGTIERFVEPKDWMKREIEYAIDLGRNIVPVFVDDFSFNDQAKKEYLAGKLENLTRYNGVYLHHDYFNEGMQKLRARFLRTSDRVELRPVPADQKLIVNQIIDDISREESDSSRLSGTGGAENTSPDPARTAERDLSHAHVAKRYQPGEHIKELAILFTIPASWLTGSLISIFMLELVPVSTFMTFGLAGGATSTLLIAWLGLSITNISGSLHARQIIRTGLYFLLAGLILGFVGEALWVLICNVSILDELIGCKDTTSISWKSVVGLSSLLALAAANVMMLVEFGGTRLVKKRR